MTDRFSPAHLPTWVPDAAQHYLAHVEQGRSMRELARDAGCHASTVLRQIRRIELRRDDILVELALQRLGPAPASGRKSARTASRAAAAPVWEGVVNRVFEEGCDDVDKGIFRWSR